ncbi:hypothetical protein [Kitasatospora herbaricolor]|uniref:Uncharacterized protein n=1 Tax=Kitasatospora herbaricolor TaxID=68217 RepID=A0ABZ1W9T4_9ACTN|nr:hypothetical protein [Kitasatospora herbaricolor]
MDRHRTPARLAGPVRRLALAVAATSTLALTVATPAIAAAPAATGAPAAQQSAAVPPAAQTGKFVPTDPHRILDTRSAIGVPTAGKVPGGTHIRVPVGLPAGDVKAVVMNVTVTGPSEESHLTVFPDGTPLPTASNLNFTAGQTVPNAVTVPVSNGFVDFYNNSGSTDVVADLAGYYTDSVGIPGSSYVPVSPARLLDTRSGGAGPVGADGTVNLRVTGTGGVPAAGASAVVLNVTATGTTSDSFLTVYPHGTARPGTSNLNWTAGQTTPNLVTVPLGADGSVDLYNHIGATQVVADVFGYYQSSPAGSAYSATGPKRMVDTRTSDSFHTLGADGIMNLPVATGGLGTTKVSAVVLNVTATNATDDSFLTVFPGNGTGRPSTSNLNFHAGQTVPNLVIVPVDDSGLINVYNHLGRVDVIVDIFGWFSLPEGGPTNLQMPELPASACATAAPGPWVPVVPGTKYRLGATMPGLSGGTTPRGWLVVVVTAPDGSVTSYEGGLAFPQTPAGTSVELAKSGPGQYSWYAYETNGTVVSAPSRPCYFQADTDSGITGVTVTSDRAPGEIVAQGQQVTFTLAATSVGATEGQRIASFCYSETPQMCTRLPATDGRATITVTASSWGTHFQYVTAYTVSGWSTQTVSFSYYVRSN